MRSVSRIAVAVACVAALLGCKKEPERSESVAVTVPSAQASRRRSPPRSRPPRPPAVPAPSAEVGKPAPDFTLTDSAGQTHQLSALRGKNVVLEWFNPDCPFVRFAHGQGPLKDLAQQVAGDRPRVALGRTRARRASRATARSATSRRSPTTR